MELYMENIVSTKTLVENVESGTIFSANFFLYGEHTLRGKKDPLSYTNRHWCTVNFIPNLKLFSK